MGASAAGQPIGTPHRRTYRAEGTLTYVTRGRGVMQGTADDQCKVPTGGAVRCLGVVEESPAAVGDPVSVVTLGEVIAISGQTALVAGLPVKVEAEGDFISCAAADVECVGYAVTTAAADGDEFVMFVLPILKKS